MSNIMDSKISYNNRIKFYGLFLLIMGFFTFSALAQNQGNEMLNQTQKAIIPIAAFTASGDMEKLKQVLAQGLDEGLTINQAKEVLVHSYAYAGFPRALNGLTSLMQVIESRKAEGKNDNIGQAASVNTDTRAMLEIGTEIQTKLVGKPVVGALYDFSPEIDEFLKSHLFGDIFIRDLFDYQTREVITVSILATLTGVEAQLQGHYAIAMHTGLSESQIKEIVAILHQQVGADVGERAQNVLNRVLKQ